MRRAIPALEKVCSTSSEHDSRGPGWYCCKCNTYNRGVKCSRCGHHNCVGGQACARE